jgi:23S rRNA (guanosine2251-2'-O)-methyltransferase
MLRNASITAGRTAIRKKPPHAGRRDTAKPPRGPAPKASAAPARQTTQKRGSDTGDRRAGPDVVRLYGFHAVREALRSGRRKLLKLYATEAAGEKLAAEAAAAGVEIKAMPAEEIAARLPREAVHQGVLLEARPLPVLDLGEIETRGIVLALDQVTDPHNVGAIVRTAAAFGVTALVTTERHAPDLAGVLAKSASGGLEHVPVVHVVNLARALDELGSMGFQRIGLDSDGPAALADTPVTLPLVLVLGAEGKGLRRLTRERCDAIARLDMPGPIKSLNVSNACAVALAMLHGQMAP